MLPIVVPPDADLEEVLRLHSVERRCRVACLTMPDGTRHVLFEDGGRRLQLMIRTDMAMEGSAVLTDAIVDLKRLERRLLSVRRLSHLIQRHILPRSLFPVDPRGRRLRIVLQALDGALAGASHQDIAAALFGRGRVLRDWRDPGRHLADQVRRAVRRGRFLMLRGYLGLLK